MAAKPLVGGGKGWEREVEAMLRAVGGYAHRHEPKMEAQIFRFVRERRGLPLRDVKDAT